MREEAVCCGEETADVQGTGPRPLWSGTSQYELVVLHLDSEVDTAVCVGGGDVFIWGTHQQLIKGAWNFFLLL